MIRFKEFLAEMTKTAEFSPSASQRRFDVDYLENPNFNEFVNYIGKHGGEKGIFGGLVTSKNNLIIWESNTLLHRDILEGIEEKASPRNFFRLAPKTLKYTFFWPSTQSTVKDIVKLKKLEKMMTDKKRPFVVIGGEVPSFKEIWVNGVQKDREEFEDETGLDVL